jgi:hypothetical protein
VLFETIICLVLALKLFPQFVIRVYVLKYTNYRISVF